MGVGRRLLAGVGVLKGIVFVEVLFRFCIGIMLALYEYGSVDLCWLHVFQGEL